MLEGEEWGECHFLPSKLEKDVYCNTQNWPRVPPPLPLSFPFKLLGKPNQTQGCGVFYKHERNRTSDRYFSGLNVYSLGNRQDKDCTPITFILLNPQEGVSDFSACFEYNRELKKMGRSMFFFVSDQTNNIDEYECL